MISPPKAFAQQAVDEAFRRQVSLLAAVGLLTGDRERFALDVAAVCEDFREATRRIDSNFA